MVPAGFDDFARCGEGLPGLLIDAASASQFAGVVPDEPRFCVVPDVEFPGGDHLLEIDAVVPHADAFEPVFLLEHPVADRAGEQQGVAAARMDDLQILGDQLARPIFSVFNFIFSPHLGQMN